MLLLVVQVPRSSLVLSAVLPLLRALATASRPGGNASLATRLQSLITKHLCKCKAVIDPVTTDTEQLSNTFKKVLYYASRDTDPGVATAAGQVLLMLLVAASSAGGKPADISQQTAANIVNDFVAKKRSRLSRQLLEQLVQRCPEALLAGDGLAELLKACRSARTDYLQVISNLRHGIQNSIKEGQFEATQTMLHVWQC